MTYHEYLLTHAWQEKRKAALLAADNRCQVCNSPDMLEVHHRTYERVGHEEPSDLTVLCASCHGIYSGKMVKPPYYWLRSLGYYIEVPIYD